MIEEIYTEDLDVLITTKFPNVSIRTNIDKYIRDIGDKITTELSVVPDCSTIGVRIDYDSVFENESDSEFFTIDVVGCKFRIDKFDCSSSEYKECFYEYQFKAFVFFLDPALTMKYVLGPLPRKHLLRRYNALEEQLHQLPFFKNEQNILYREFKDEYQYLKRVFYIKQGEKLKFCAAYENIWIKVLGGKGVVNKNVYDWYKKKKPMSKRIRLNRTFKELSFEGEVSVRGSGDGLHANSLIFTNSQVKDFVIYVAYC